MCSNLRYHLTQQNRETSRETSNNFSMKLIECNLKCGLCYASRGISLPEDIFSLLRAGKDEQEASRNLRGFTCRSANLHCERIADSFWSPLSDSGAKALRNLHGLLSVGSCSYRSSTPLITDVSRPAHLMPLPLTKKQEKRILIPEPAPLSAEDKQKAFCDSEKMRILPRSLTFSDSNVIHQETSSSDKQVKRSRDILLALEVEESKRRKLEQSAVQKPSQNDYCEAVMIRVGTSLRDGILLPDGTVKLVEDSDGDVGSELADDSDSEFDILQPRAERVIMKKHRPRFKEAQEMLLIDKAIRAGLHGLQPRHFHRIHPEIRLKNPAAKRSWMQRLRTCYRIIHPGTQKRTELSGALPTFRGRKAGEKKLSIFEVLRRLESNALSYDLVRWEASRQGRTRFRLFNADETPLLHTYAPNAKASANFHDSLDFKSRKSLAVDTAKSSTLLAYVSSEKSFIPKPLLILAQWQFKAKGLNSSRSKLRSRVIDAFADAYGENSSLTRVVDSDNSPGMAKTDGSIDSKKFLAEIHALIELKRPRDVADIFIFDSAPEHFLRAHTVKRAKERGLYFVRLEGKTTSLMQPLDGRPFALIKKNFREFSCAKTATVENPLNWRSVRSALYETSGPEIFCEHGFSLGPEGSEGPYLPPKAEIRGIYAEARRTDRALYQRTMDEFALRRTEFFIRNIPLPERELDRIEETEDS